MPVLVLAHLDDRVALGVAAALRRARREVLALAPEALAMAPGIRYRQAPKLPGSELAIDWEIRLAGGELLQPGQVGAVFNRLRSVDAPHFANSDPADREYAQAESAAWLVSWLAALDAAGVRVVNPVRHGALQPGWGGWEHFPPTAAEQPGLAAPARLLVAGEERVWQGEPASDLRSDEFETWIRAEQARSGWVLGELRFARTAGDWQVSGLELFPLAVNRAGIAAIERALG